MEFWIEQGRLMTWMDSRRIQEIDITSGVVDADYNHSTGEWLVVRTNGQVESIVDRIPKRTFDSNGARARWIGESVQVTTRSGQVNIYNSRGFLESSR